MKLSHDEKGNLGIERPLVLSGVGSTWPKWLVRWNNTSRFLGSALLVKHIATKMGQCTRLLAMDQCIWCSQDLGGHLVHYGWTMRIHSCWWNRGKTILSVCCQVEKGSKWSLSTCLRSFKQSALEKKRRVRYLGDKSVSEEKHKLQGRLSSGLYLWKCPTYQCTRWNRNWYGNKNNQHIRPVSQVLETHCSCH